MLRLVMHLHNYLAGSWHEKRQSLVLHYLDAIQAKHICEIGFGVPQRYVRSFLPRPEARLLLADFEASSLSFAQHLLSYWNHGWRQRIDLCLFDMNCDLLPEGFDGYLFQDSIEHALDPSATLRRFVEAVQVGTSLLFSLPIEIEHPVPEHHICWSNEEEVYAWLERAGLSIVS